MLSSDSSVQYLRPSKPLDPQCEAKTLFHFAAGRGGIRQATIEPLFLSSCLFAAAAAFVNNIKIFSESYFISGVSCFLF